MKNIIKVPKKGLEYTSLITGEHNHKLAGVVETTERENSADFLTFKLDEESVLLHLTQDNTQAEHHLIVLPAGEYFSIAQGEYNPILGQFLKVWD